MFTVAALYHFTRFDDPGALIPPLRDLCARVGLRGTLILAREGLNGTLAGPEPGIAALISHLRGLPGCADLEWKRAQATKLPFHRLKIRLKREIVTMGQPGLDPATQGTGHYVEPEAWNALISSPDVAVIDTRNAYEVAIGTFDGAIDPNTAKFADFPSWWEANKTRFANKRIAMFCTGGIRCEKSTNYLRAQGLEEVYHLKGGILRYLEKVAPEESLWRGECFVFDQRVSVGHGLHPGPWELCHACRRPLHPRDKTHPAYEPGVQCPACVSEFSAADRARFRERQRQVDLAAQDGRHHIGPAD